jgi:hypothetical protein
LTEIKPQPSSQQASLSLRGSSSEQDKMTVSRLLAAALVCAMGLAAPSAKAALIAVDSPFGPDTIIRDTDTNLDWLSLQATVGFAFNDIWEEPALPLKPRAPFTGFELATLGEVAKLMAYFGADLSANSCAACDFDRAVDFVELFGGTARITGYSGPILEFFFDANYVELFAASVYLYTASNEVEVDSQLVNPRLDEPSQFGWGWFLVRPAQDGHPVPEPATIALFGVGYLALVLVRRRRRAVFR